LAIWDERRGLLPQTIILILPRVPNHPNRGTWAIGNALQHWQLWIWRLLAGKMWIWTVAFLVFSLKVVAIMITKAAGNALPKTGIETDLDRTEIVIRIVIEIVTEIEIVTKIEMAIEMKHNILWIWTVAVQLFSRKVATKEAAGRPRTELPKAGIEIEIVIRIVTEIEMAIETKKEMAIIEIKKKRRTEAAAAAVMVETGMILAVAAVAAVAARVVVLLAVKVVGPGPSL
jgi:hypothetical protein